MHEVLASAQKDIAEKYDNEFAGITMEPVDLDDLLAARVSLVETIIGEMPAQRREFLIGFEGGKPNWILLDLPDAAQLPSNGVGSAPSRFSYTVRSLPALLHFWLAGSPLNCVSYLSGTLSQAAASGGGVPLSTILGHFLAYSALSVSHRSRPDSVSA